MWLLICPKCRWGADFYGSTFTLSRDHPCDTCGSATTLYEVKGLLTSGNFGKRLDIARKLLKDALGDLISDNVGQWHVFKNKRLIDCVEAGVSPFIDRNDIEFHMREEDADPSR